MPGLDRISSKAWKQLGNLGVDVLFEAMLILSSDEAEDKLESAYRDDGRHDILCCLPKKKAGVDEEAGDYYAADATRSLSIVNTDNNMGRVIGGSPSSTRGCLNFNKGSYETVPC